MGSWILYYLLPTDAKSLLFCMKQNCLGLQYRDLSSRAQHFVMKPCLCVNLSGICPFFTCHKFSYWEFFPSKWKLLYPQMFYLVLDAIKTSPIISYRRTDTNLIWIYLMKNYWGILFFVGYNLNTYFIRAREGRDVGLWHKWLLLKSNAKYRKRGDRVGDQTDRIVKLSHLNVFAEFEYIIEFSLPF